MRLPIALSIAVVPFLMGAQAMGETPWDLRELSKAPKVWPTDAQGEKGVEAVFYEGERLEGKPTRVFAWIGMPELAKAPRGYKSPGVVLVHGGAGSAFAQWVRQWNEAGYAAIAMDTCGCVPKPGKIASGERHEWAGPPGWGGMDQVDKPIRDQWPYHAVAAVIRGHSLLAGRAGVDPNRIGMMGISWGGYLASIVAGVDTRLEYAVPVYGCGFLGERKGYAGFPRHENPRQRGKWLARWDPNQFLPAAKLPMLWVNGTNDLAFPLACVQDSADVTPGPDTFCYRVRMTHNYGTPWGTKEVMAFADSLNGKGKPLARIAEADCDGNRLTVKFRSGAGVVAANLCSTADSGALLHRKWAEQSAELDAAAGKASAAMPEGTTACFMNLVDERGLLVSSRYMEPGRK
jgi:cephalosporin-C deacetylase-like acetyl esterase